MRTKPPKDGSPWVVPANEARGSYVHTEKGILPLIDMIDKKKLRPDQLDVPKKWSPY